VTPTNPIAALLFILATMAPLVVCARVVGRRGRAAASIADTLSPRGRDMLRAWMLLAVLLGLLLPGLALCLWHDDPHVRAALLPSVIVLLVQTQIERACAGRLPLDVSPLIGVVYTGYRLWQLWYATRLFAATPTPGGLMHAAILGLLAAGLVFWSANVVFLSVVGVPRAIRAIAPTTRSTPA
jgi:hypothetical protein